MHQLLCRIHMYGARTHLHPSLCATVILMSSSDSRSPTDVIDGAASLLSVAMMLPTVWLCRCQWRRATSSSCRSATNLSHALWMCADSAHGFWLLDKEVHLVSTAGRDSSSDDPTDTGRMDSWRMQLKPKGWKVPASAHFLFQILHVYYYYYLLTTPIWKCSVGPTQKKIYHSGRNFSNTVRDLLLLFYLLNVVSEQRPKYREGGKFCASVDDQRLSIAFSFKGKGFASLATW